MSLQTKRLIVNAITFGRVPFVVVFMVLAIWHGYTPQHSQFILRYDWIAIAATASLVIASLTDLYDGKLARRWQVVSKFGAMADPLMDKVFYLVVFPTLLWLLGKQPQAVEGVHAVIMLIFTVLYILRDQWVTFLRAVGSLYQANCGAMWLGKVRTAATFPCACIIYLYASLHLACIPQWLVYVIEAALIILNFWSMITYTKAYLPYLKKSLE